MLVLGIETSCDETSVAIVDDEKNIRANIINSQNLEHSEYGGVVPEIAARAHLHHLQAVIQQALGEAGIGFEDLDAISVTAGPGLIGGVIVGVSMAKSLALATGKPLVAINHLEAHALTVRLTDEVAFPYLLLLVSGGHCQLLSIEGIGRYRLLGQTIDDALGEAFDKTARILGLGYPGGPAVERAATRGDAGVFALPRPLYGRDGCDFSFAGLKTAVRNAVLKLPAGEAEDDMAADLCASFQKVCGDILVDRCRNAVQQSRAGAGVCERLVVAGGVAANKYLGARLTAFCADESLTLHVPPPALCTDNGAMVAWAGLERFRLGQRDRLDVAPTPRWPLDQLGPP